MGKTGAKSKILEAVYESAQDLYELGFINKARMQAYEALCIEPVKPYDNQEIRALRDRYKLSQSALAIVLNTSPSTIRKWEIGNKHPSGPSLKLLNILDRKGLEALI
jgi:putative transcriptional regulator